jgi:isopentenyl-diphosphate delta-isomerase
LSSPNSHSNHRPSDQEERIDHFESRKQDHIRIALDEVSQTKDSSGLEHFRLKHEAFPEIDFSDVKISTQVFGKTLASPMFISSMTAGHGGSLNVNLTMAQACEKRNWAMGVGSQRRQLHDRAADQEWLEIRKLCPSVMFFGNIGIAQAIVTPVDQIRRLVDSLQATALFVHTNPLQECLQPEGTPQFRGGLKCLEGLARDLGVPVIVKETGSGFSINTLERLRGLGLAAVDVSGLGGTHWGRVEGERSPPGEMLHGVAQTFRNWGVSTVESLQSALRLNLDYQVWASGGVRTGLDVALFLSMGAQMVGLAKPIIEAALKGPEVLDQRLATLEYELKTALFCTGSVDVHDLQEKAVWEMIK